MRGPSKESGSEIGIEHEVGGEDREAVVCVGVRAPLPWIGPEWEVSVEMLRRRSSTTTVT